MNKLLTLSLAAATSAAFLAQPVMSQDDGIVVMPSISEEAFVEKVSHDLDWQLARAARQDEAYGDGIAIVRFTRDGNGQPADMSIYRRSGKATLDRVAVRAVRRLKSLDQVPAGVTEDQLYQANIIFASSPRSFERLNDKLAREEAARIAASAGKTRVLAFGSVPGNPPS